MPQRWTLDIAGCACPLTEPEAVLCDLWGVFAEFQRRADAYAVATETAIVVRSLCHLYDGLALAEAIPGRDLKRAIAQLSERLGGGRRRGRFTSIAAVLASIRRTAAMPTSHVPS